MGTRKDSTANLRSLVSDNLDKWKGLANGTGRGGLTWHDADAEELRAAIAAVTEDGAALILSKTQDGGALALQVLSGAGRFKLYPATPDELAAALGHIQSIALQH